MTDEELWTYVASTLASFASVFLKGFQHQNVAGRHYRLTFVTSYLMALMDVATVGFIVKYGWAVALTSGTGAALGMVTSMWAPSRFVRRG